MELLQCLVPASIAWGYVPSAHIFRQQSSAKIRNSHGLNPYISVYQNQDTAAKWLFDICSLTGGMCWRQGQPQKQDGRLWPDLRACLGTSWVVFWG